MKLSPAGLHLIASFEGYVGTKPYNDPVGFCTIGFGHLIATRRCTPADDAAWAHATEASLYAQLLADTAHYSAAVTSAVKVSLGVLPSHAQARFDALVSLAYNIGVSGFESSSLLREINRKGAPRKWTPLAPYWYAWDMAGGHPILLPRRRQEFAIFAPGKYP